MAYTLNPINADPLKQKFPVEADSFEGLTPKANELLGTIGVPDPEVIVTPFDFVNNGEVQLEVADVEKIASSGSESSSSDSSSNETSGVTETTSATTETTSGTTTNP